MNPTGSIKDRVALAMVEDAKSEKYFKDDAGFVDPTSGNTGISLALQATLKGKLPLLELKPFTVHFFFVSFVDLN